MKYAKYIAAALAASLLLSGCGKEVSSSDGFVIHETPLDQIGQSSKPDASESDISSEISADTSSDTSSETTSELSSDVSSEVSSDVSSEVSSEVSSNVSSQTSSTVQSSGVVAWEEVPAGDWNLVLVNAITPIADDHQMTLVNYNDNIKCDKRVLSALTAMMKAAKNDGVSIYPTSGYRSKERSEYLYKNQVQKYLDRGYSREQALVIAAHWVAPPGTSEHHTGLAFDFLSNESTTMNETFASTKAAKWLKENAADYGFCLRFPKGKEDITGIVFEPWHYRYVGSEAAAYIMEHELTLEEYLGAPEVGYEDIEE